MPSIHIWQFDVQYTALRYYVQYSEFCSYNCTDEEMFWLGAFVAKVSTPHKDTNTSLYLPFLIFIFIF